MEDRDHEGYSELPIYDHYGDQELEIDMLAVESENLVVCQVMNLKKCSFLCDMVVYLGFIASVEGLKPDPSKLGRYLKIQNFHCLASFPITERLKEALPFNVQKLQLKLLFASKQP